MRIHQQKAYVLLNRPYSETSWIVEVFSRDYGRLALIAKGARRVKSKLKGALFPFQPLLLSWVGKGEVPTLTSAEIDQRDYNLIRHELSGDALVCGFYCNELIANLLHRYDAHRKLFDDYHNTIMTLNMAEVDDNLSVVLRDFEQRVIKETGYEVNFEYEADNKTPINDHGMYRFQPTQGFVRTSVSHPKAVSGRIIRSMSAEVSASYSAQEISQGKHLMRDILSQTLGYKKIVSRELFFPKY